MTDQTKPPQGFVAVMSNSVKGMSLIGGVMGSFPILLVFCVEGRQRYWDFMKYLSLFKYPFESFMINEYGGEGGMLKCLEIVGGECLMFGDRFLMHQVLEEQKWNNLVVMLSFVVRYIFVGFVFLWYISKS